MVKRFLGLFILLSLSACSSKNLYQFGQQYQQSECFNQAQNEAQFNQCLNEHHLSYEEYTKEREAILKKARDNKSQPESTQS